MGGPTGTTGGAVDWISRLLGFASGSEAFGALGSEVMRLPIGCDGLSLNPALSGSRLPAWSSGERGLLSGLGQHHGPAHVLRAAYEGAAFVVLEGIDALRAAGVKVDEVVVVGGLARQPDLVRLRSELWGIPVRVLAGQEATTAGAAMLAGIASEVYGDAEHAASALVPSSRTVFPGEVSQSDVARARRRWRASSEFARALEEMPGMNPAE